jgi:hypothetical protein
MLSKMAKIFPFSILIVMWIGVTPGLGQAPTSGTALSEALKVAEEAADRICGEIAHSGSRSSQEIGGAVHATLPWLAKKLADLGITGTGQFADQQYYGVLQEDLASSLKEERDCKLTVVKDVMDRLQPAKSNTQARNPNALYQYDEIVGEVQGAVIQQANGIVRFQTVQDNGRADPNKEVEYQDWRLLCPLPTSDPNEIGPSSGVEVGVTCNILGKRVQ